MKIEVDTETHAVTSRASPMGIIFIIGILFLRIVLRDAATRIPLGIPAAAIANGLLLLLAAMVVTQSLEMWLRARRLLSEARAAKEASGLPEGQPPIAT
jgi:hypothetical protein